MPLRPIAVATAILTAVTLAVAVATPPLSGPFCTEGCFRYPSHDIAPRFPRDYLWMMLAIPQSVAVILFLSALHGHARPEARPWTRGALAFGALASGVLIVTYWIQLAVIQPSLLAGETEGLALLTQFNPHGLFIALEEIGYLLLALAFLLLAPAVPGPGAAARGLRWLLGAGVLAAVLAVGWTLLAFGHLREYRLEVALISIDWLVLTLAPLLVAALPRTAWADPS